MNAARMKNWKCYLETRNNGKRCSHDSTFQMGESEYHRTYKMSNLQSKLALVVAIVLLCCEPLSAWQIDAYMADTIWTGEGKPIENGVLLVVDGKIQSVGTQDAVEIPATARRHVLQGRTIMPGIVAAQTQLAGSQDAQRTLTPQILAVDGFDFFADRGDYLESGITSAQISAGEDRLMPGVNAVVKLWGDDLDARILTDRESLRVKLDESARKPPRIYEPMVGPVSEDRPLEPTQPQLSTLASSLAALRVIFDKASDDSSDSDDEITKRLAEHLKNKGVVRISAKTPAEIRAAINMAKKYDLQIILTECQDLEPFQDDLAEWSKFVKGVVLYGQASGKITNPSLEDLNQKSHPWKLVAGLNQAGIPVAINATNAADWKDVLFIAGQFMKGGVSEEELVSMLTGNPATMMGIDNRVGLLKAGNDADFIVLNNAPFALHASVMKTYVDGKQTFEREAPAKTTLIRANRIYTGDGQFMDDANLVIKGKTVRALGPDVSAPVDVSVRDFGDAVIVPGFVDMGTGLGLGGPVSGSVRLGTQLGEQLYADDPAIKYAREQGVTTVLLGSMSASTGTPLVAFKLGDDVRVISDPAAIRFRVNDEPSSSITALRKALTAGKAYHESFIKYQKDLAAYNEKKAAAKKEAEAAAAKAKSEKPKESADAEKKTADKEEKPDEKPEEKKPDSDKPEEKPGDSEKEKPAEKDEKPADKKTEDGKPAQETADPKKPDDEKKSPEAKEDAPPKEPKVNKALEPYRALFSGQIPAIVEARQGPAIEQALKLFEDEFKVRTIIAGADDLARFSDLFEGYDAGVIAGPEIMVTKDRTVTNLAQLLANENIPFGFQSKGTTGVGQLPTAIQYSISKGLGVHDGLQGLTASPARLLSKEMTFGSLARGKDADLVVLSGPPFENATEILAVMIDGEWVYDQKEQK